METSSALLLSRAPCELPPIHVDEQALDDFMKAGIGEIIRYVKVSDVFARTRYRPICNVVSLRRGQNGAVVIDDAEPHRSSLLLWLVE
jgi:hypothetical protein